MAETLYARPTDAEKADDQAKVDRATAALGGLRRLLHEVNGRGASVMATALKGGISLHPLCPDQMAGRLNPMCSAIRRFQH